MPRGCAEQASPPKGNARDHDKWLRLVRRRTRDLGVPLSGPGDKRPVPEKRTLLPVVRMPGEEAERRGDFRAKTMAHGRGALRTPCSLAVANDDGGHPRKGLNAMTSGLVELAVSPYQIALGRQSKAIL